MWDHFFRDGGWGMYPTTVFGFLLVLAGVLCVLRPERRFAHLGLTLAGLTLCSGALGTVTGFVTTFRFLHQVPDLDRRFTIAAFGVAESLNNMILALLLVTFTGVLGALAALRVALAPAVAPPR